MKRNANSNKTKCPYRAAKMPQKCWNRRQLWVQSYASSIQINTFKAWNEIISLYHNATMYSQSCSEATLTKAHWRGAALHGACMLCKVFVSYWSSSSFLKSSIIYTWPENCPFHKNIKFIYRKCIFKVTLIFAVSSQSVISSFFSCPHLYILIWIKFT